MFNSDKPAEADHLGREPFAKEIAFNLVNSFKNGDTSIAIGLIGKWGCGKSTLMNFIKKDIKAEYERKGDGNYVIVDFNPWMFSGQIELQSIFLNILIEKVPDVNHSLKKFFKKFSEASRPFRVAAELNPNLSIFTKVWNAVVDSIVKPPSLEELRRNIDENIVALDIRFYIFIDDLDRLPPDEVAEILQLIKLNASFKNTYYIVAYDAEYVVQALVNKYGENGREYLEKIIQVDFAVPEVRAENIENIFFHQLKEFISRHSLKITTEDVFKIWKYRGLRGIFSTPRDVYRYFNALQLRLPVIKEEIDVVDFMILEAIRVFDYEFYLEIVKEAATDKYSNRFSKSIFTDRREGADPISKLFKYLILDEKYRYEMVYNTKKRFVDPWFMDRYVSLSISPKDVSEDELRTFITQPSRRAKVLDSAHFFGRSENLLRRLCNPLLKQDYITIDFEINDSLMIFWDSDSRWKEFDKLHEAVIDSMFNVIYLSDNPGKSMELLISSLIHYGGRLSIVRFSVLDYIIYHFGKRHNQILYNQLKPQVALFESDINLAYQKMLKDWIHFFLPHQTELDTWIMGRHFVFRYSQNFPEEYAKKLGEIIGNRNLDSYKAIVSLMNCVLTPSYPKGDFRLENIINELIPPQVRDAFVSRLKSIDEGLLNADNQSARKFFLNAMKDDVKLVEVTD